MLAICKAEKPGPIKAPKNSSKDKKKVTKVTKPGDKAGRRKNKIPFTYHHLQSKIQATKASTLVIVELHKEDQQATSGATSLGVTSKGGAHPQLSSGMIASIYTKPIYFVSTIIHFKPALRWDASADSIAESNLGISAPNDSISKQQDINKGTKNYLIDHIFAGTNPHVVIEQTKSVSEGSEDTQKEIKLEDLSKLVQDMGVDIMDLDLPNDDEPIIVQDKSDEEVHTEKIQPEEPKEAKDASASHPPSPKTIEIQELTN
ncbi:hypothetical protein Tco_1526303 [Tanacetum coccineum]